MYSKGIARDSVSSIDSANISKIALSFSQTRLHGSDSRFADILLLFTFHSQTHLVRILNVIDGFLCGFIAVLFEGDDLRLLVVHVGHGSANTGVDIGRVAYYILAVPEGQPVSVDVFV